MKVIFKRPKLFAGYTGEVELDCVPRVGDRVVLCDQTEYDYCEVATVEHYPFGEHPEDIRSIVYITTKDIS